MSVPSRKTVFIVDAMAFRRARVESFLSRWAASEAVKLISLDPKEARAKLVERNDCDMLIYSVGTPSAYEIFAEVQVLHALRRQAALAIVSDDQSPATIIAVMRSGAQGYFSNSMPPDLALQALSFVLRGGTYFPPRAIMSSDASGGRLPIERKQQGLPHQRPLPDAEQQNQPPPLGPADGIYERRPSTSNGVRPARGLSERQYAVLTCLCLGDPNKVIGRKLGMTEMTVKVHVREIMRKLGVCNRTQVAIAAARNGTRIGPDGMVEIVPLDSTAKATSSPSHQLP